MEKKSDAQLFQVHFSPYQKFESFLKEKENPASEKTIQGYLRDIKQFENFLHETGGSLHQLTRVDVQNYMNHLKEQGRAASTINRHFNAIKQFSMALGFNGVCEGIRKTKPPGVQDLSPKSLERKDLLGILRKVEQMNDVRASAIIYLLAYTGIRIEECENLNRKDLDFKRGGTINVVGKGDKPRKVPFPNEAKLHVKRYLETRDDDNPALFLSNYRKRMNKRSLQRVVEKVGKLYNALLPVEEQIELHAHTFRHTFARNLVVEKKLDIVTVAAIMGHQSIEVTRRYAMDSIQNVSEKLDDMTY
ncbi:tyrosine-type recombinase/integrase [Bacillus sp. JJ634]